MPLGFINFLMIVQDSLTVALATYQECPQEQLKNYFNNRRDDFHAEKTEVQRFGKQTTVLVLKVNDVSGKKDKIMYIGFRGTDPKDTDDLLTDINIAMSEIEQRWWITKKLGSILPNSFKKSKYIYG